MSTYLKPKARNLQCIFADLAEKYDKIGLKPCETKESQKWRYADNENTAKKLLQYHTYLPELVNRHCSLMSIQFVKGTIIKPLLLISFISIL